ncbi:8-oxoguanine DNA glycosylase [Arctopsyche grandis]|uniref:8-oxoguanine DNA glycosylase n=1 Tax=Arctopsyche grandis TaxID=121162 RepID=UPI00406D676C
MAKILARVCVRIDGINMKRVDKRGAGVDLGAVPWRVLNVSDQPLQLKLCLSGGQSFRWKYKEESDEWTGIVRGSVFKLKETKDGLLYQVLGSVHSTKPDSKVTRNATGIPNTQTEDERHESILKKYFRLDVDLKSLYEDWSKKDSIFKAAADKFYGVRMLAQEPVENLFSFICSQNNHITRISSMIEKLCSTYGQRICEDGEIIYYSFPSVDSLSSVEVESNLRELGFGYRAKFIQKSAAQIQEWGENEWFESLMKKPYKEAKSELIKLPGVGPKVADCICLMSLNHLEAVPVDTHVYQIAANLYLKHLKGRKSVTDAVYNEIGDHFRDMYGPLAGWAHTVLFCADLKKFEESGSKRISDETNKKTKRKKSN